MQHDGMLWEQSEALLGQSVIDRVLTLGREESPFIRSACTRSIRTASSPGSSASNEWATVTGQDEAPTGSSVGGATRTTSAPSIDSSSALDLATRLCRMSPTMAMRLPSMSPRRCRSVSASSSAWVGCSWVPSPALMIAGPPSWPAVHEAIW